MRQAQTPNGIPVNVPETTAEDPSPKFGLDQMDSALAYYHSEGYVVMTGLLDPALCDQARSLWESEVKPFDGFMYRQATSKAERHVRNELGWVMNPILNLQSVDPRRFPQFRTFAIQRVLSHERISRVFSAVLGDAPKVVQSMYFEGNSATWEHQDSPYLDSEDVGSMVAAWIALEDIHALAGRFFVCPKSHRLELGEQSVHPSMTASHAAYIERIVALIKERQMPIHAPKLDKGDVLFWNALTIHGSLASVAGAGSRSSITCHAIRARDRFLSLRARAFNVPTTQVGSVYLYAPKDQSALRNRGILLVESRFPKLFYWAKRQAIRYRFRHRSSVDASAH